MARGIGRFLDSNGAIYGCELARLAHTPFENIEHIRIERSVLQLLESLAKRPKVNPDSC